MKKFFIKMMTPCHFRSEEAIREIQSLDLENAKAIAKDFSTNYGKCYAFYLFTKERGENDFEPKISYTSECHYIRGEVKTIQEVEQKEGKKSILYENMLFNKWERVIEVDGKCFPILDNDIYHHAY